jgi:predicted transcriptional regulator
MRHSKLEMHVEILKVLAQKGPLQLKHLMSQGNVNCNILKEHLGFLIKQGLVEEVVVDKNNVVYENTDRGTSVIRFFEQLDKSFPAKLEEGESCSFQIKAGE